MPKDAATTELIAGSRPRYEAADMAGLVELHLAGSDKLLTQTPTGSLNPGFRCRQRHA